MKTKLICMLVACVVAMKVFSLLASAQERGIGVGAGTSRMGGYYALVIGNNAYSHLPRLKTAEADAREVEALLKDKYGFETTLLLNATRQQIISALSGYRRTLSSEANLLIYYAGHGFNDKDADKAYWLPVDAERDNTSNWIIADEITTSLKVIPARHVLVVSDSCYSGTLTRGLGEAVPPVAERDQFINRMAAGLSRTLMASGGDEPVADGGGGGKHSVFANALLRGLREIEKHRFTAAELFRYYVEERVAGRAEQVPEYNPIRNSGHQSGDFVFIKATAAAASVAKSTAALIDNKTDSSDSGRAVEPSTPASGTPVPGVMVKTRLGIELVYVPPGEFMMGSTVGGTREKPVHNVKISGFYMGRYEVTQALWQAVMGIPFVGCDACPVERVSWNEVQDFIRKLNEQNDGFKYRLPSEAEWEYACRGGSTRDHAGYVEAMAWYDANSEKKTHVVGQKQPNTFGLYDMHGNVWEWVQDTWHETYSGAPTDGSAWESEVDVAKRVARGGSWYNAPAQLRSAVRSPNPPGTRANTIGFRIVAVPR